MNGDEEDYYMSKAFDDSEAEHEMALARMKERLRKQAGKGPSRDKARREPHTSIAKVEQDRSRKNSRRKGNRNELDVAKLFSQWCGESVRRTPGSGGWKGAKEFGTTADLVCKKKEFPFHVEVKHREGWVLDDLVTGVRRDHDKSIVQWWIQCVESCPQLKGKNDYVVLKKEPLLVFRRNRQPWLVMFRRAVDSPASRHEWRASFELPDVMVGDVVVMLLTEFLDSEPVPKGLKHARSK